MRKERKNPKSSANHSKQAATEVKIVRKKEFVELTPGDIVSENYTFVSARTMEPLFKPEELQRTRLKVRRSA